jgi:DNA segregation ATPase FtsK/SpoIIIE, S-DNA-T family
MLQYLQLEMQKRGNLLDQHEVSHIDDLPHSLPYILLCIDEVALLQDEKEIMKLIEEISAIGRALGCF